MEALSSLVEARIAAKKQRWIDFYQSSGAPSSVFIINYLPDACPRPFPRPAAIQERIEWAWEKYQRQLERLNWLDDDSVPFLDVYTGTEVFAESLAAPCFTPKMICRLPNPWSTAPKKQNNWRFQNQMYLLFGYCLTLLTNCAAGQEGRESYAWSICKAQWMWPR